jgi:type II secretory ATPase GspE/PulE/Tfp pilus assembly ATPase PilB-like protein
VETGDQSQLGVDRLVAAGEQVSTIRTVNALIADAVRRGASDLHIEPEPTGSGKTTSLYAALNHLNRDDINIITVEDPVESRLLGITQVQVHDRAGRSFANTLRAHHSSDCLLIKRFSAGLPGVS